ncbi:type II 3-dehydroquinate dehydratase [Candidatus Nardonella dryophthoridicola]|uniref:3-dehydroquinate dehydratase n=1 Tax=endosymbiont of Rhynchophorus ferrugineus TaxID=1972133 RepID=A0A2Z5T3U4_9GAMM|nr:type II 3-dehydroquinate dehydratase [Candidatus Nardonella dryophthoridicola]QTJ62827.1 type II 3-dehydroquinate dehydratase [Candidatus Nardonella dryophthoridicola]BBA85071.1 3-dehydroquinate dehydratase [endosymbiont of Rhynchophorus ferrugineus]
MKNILIINGPNLNLLGTREVEKYGKLTLKELINKLKNKSKELNINLYHIQSNSESKIIKYIHSSKKNKIEFILINGASLTHTSISIRDAILAVSIPIIEIHISNIYSREQFRRFSYLSDIALGIICGFGIDGYLYALEYVSKYKKNV